MSAVLAHIQEARASLTKANNSGLLSAEDQGSVLDLITDLVRLERRVERSPRTSPVRLRPSQELDRFRLIAAE